MRLVSFSPLIVVRPQSPFGTAAELVSAAKKDPGKVTIGYPGEATISHLNVEALKRVAGINLTGVPFAGWGQAAPALLGGHVDAMVAQPGETLPQLKGGALRALGSLSPKRQPGMPDIPTWKEQGIDVGLSAEYLLIMPPKTPPEIVKYVHDAAKSALDEPAFRDFVKARAMETDYADGATTKQGLWEQYRKYTQLLDQMGVLNQQ